jgi:hypothetical protein
VPCAIIESKGALGMGLIGQSRVAVPLQELRWSNRSRELTVMATKQQLESASREPNGQWAAIRQDGGLGNVNRFYGQLSAFGQAQYERQPTVGNEQGREPVRNPSDQGFQSSRRIGVVTISKSEDGQLASRVNQLVEQDIPNAPRRVQATLRDGVVTLTGRVSSEDQKDMLDRQIRNLPGVTDVQNNLTTSQE